MFSAALFTIAKTWKQLLDKEDVVHIYNGILFRHKKKKMKIVICHNMMNLESIKLSQIEKDKNHIISFIYGI